MISDSWVFNLLGGAFLALIATAALVEAKSNALVSKALFLWPALLVIYGILNLLQGWRAEGLSVSVALGVLLILCGIQAALVNLRRFSPWPSGGIWLGLVPAGLGFQLYPLLEQRLMGFLWVAIGISKVIRERSASLESGTPIWILLLYAEAILLAAYR